MNPRGKGDNKKVEYDKFNDAIAESVSSDNELARDFLIEEGKNADEIVSRGLSLVRRLQAEARNKLAIERKQKSESLLQRFLDWCNDNASIKEPRFEQLRLNYRGLEALDEDEKDRILKDALYLQFLEEQGEEHDE